MTLGAGLRESQVSGIRASRIQFEPVNWVGSKKGCYKVRWRFLLMIGIPVKVEIVVFCDPNLFLGLCPTRRPAMQLL